MPNPPIWPTQPIPNAKDTNLGQNPGTLPDMSGDIANWFQLIVMERITKAVVNFVVQETTEPVLFQGIVQPFSANQLSMKPEGQRAWKWLKIICWANVPLVPDDVVVYEGVQYRVIDLYDWKQYGFREYNIQSDFTGSGPSTP
jgi:hypothetical protein